MSKRIIIPAAFFFVLTCLILVSCSQNPGSQNSLDEPVYTNLVWSDEFNLAPGSSLDSADWTLETGGGGWGNNELQVYTTTNYHFEDDGGGTNNYLLSIDCYNIGGYTSLRMISKGKKYFQYARFVARIKMDVAGQGGWPAFWLMGENIDSVGWPGCGEIDIMECGLNGAFDSIGGTLHWSDGGSHKYSGSTIANSSYTNAFHEFEVFTTASYIFWKMDGTEFYRASLSDKTGSDFHQPFFILLNLAIGGPSTPYTGYKPVDDARFPKHMYVDWVRVYQ